MSISQGPAQVPVNKYSDRDARLTQAVVAYQMGDTSRFEEIYDLSKNYLYRRIQTLVKNPSITEELLQETYIIVFKSINQLREPNKFLSWAGAGAAHLAERWLKRSGNFNISLDEESADPEGKSYAETIMDKASMDHEEFIPEAVIMDQESRRLLYEIIDSMSVEKKLTVQYYYFDDMSVNEIAAGMGCSVGTVKSRLNYARQAIKDGVLKLEKEHGTKLYSLSALPLLLLLFRDSAETGATTTTTASAMAERVLGGQVANPVYGAGGTNGVSGNYGVGGANGISGAYGVSPANGGYYGPGVNGATANMGPASGVSSGIGAGMPYAGAAGATGFGAVGAAGAAAAKSSIGGILGWLFGSLALVGALVAGGIALNNALNNHDTSSPYASVSAPYTNAGTGSTAGTNSSVSGNPWQNNTAQNNYTQNSTLPNTGFSTGNQITRTSDPIGVFRETYIHLGVPAATVDTLIAEADNEVTDCYEHMGTYFDLINQEKEALLEALDANSVKISDVDTVINDGYDQRLAAIALELEEVINLYKTKSENTDASKYFYNRKLLFDGELTMEELRIRLLKSDTARSGLVTSEMTAVSFYKKFFKSDEVFDELSVTEGPWQNSFNLYAFQKQFNSNQRAWFDSPAMNPSLKSLLKANASSDSLVNSEQYKALSNH